MMTSLYHFFKSSVIKNKKYQIIFEKVLKNKKVYDIISEPILKMSFRSFIISALRIDVFYRILYKNVYSCITERYFAYGEYIHTLRLTSLLVDLRVGYAKRIQ